MEFLSVSGSSVFCVDAWRGETSVIWLDITVE